MNVTTRPFPGVPGVSGAAPGRGGGQLGRAGHLVLQHGQALVLQTLHLPPVPQPSNLCPVNIDNNILLCTCTWLEENDGLQTSELCGVNIQLLEQVHDGAELREGRGEGGGQVGELAAGEDGGGVEREAPLDGAQQEQLRPALLQQHGLAHNIGHASRVTCHVSPGHWGPGRRRRRGSWST